MKTLEVSSLLEGIDSVVRQIESQKAQLKELERAVASFTDLGDSFTGVGGDAIRRYYREWHLPLIAYRSLTLEKFEGLLQNLKQATSALEPAHDGYILESHLEGPLTNGVTKSESVTAALVDEGNSYMDAVSDIISLPRLKDDAFREGVRDAKRHIRQTIQDLNTYDYSQTGELSALDADLDLMDGYLKDLSGIFGNPSFRIETYDLQLQDFSGYQKLRVNLAQEQLKEFAMGFSMFFSSLWLVFGSHLIQSKKSDEFVYEMLRGYERRYEELERIIESGVESQGEEFIRGPHQVARGKEINLAALDAMDGVSIETYNLRGVPLHYSIINNKLVIYRDNPNLWYSTQNAEVTLLQEVLATSVKTVSTIQGDRMLGKIGSRLPGSSTISGKIKGSPEIPFTGKKSGEIVKEEISENIQKKIPFWGEIISADVPKAGTKQVIVYLSGDGVQYDRRVSLTLGKDGVLSIKEWYTGELNTLKQKDHNEVTFSDLWNWTQNNTDPNFSKDSPEEAKRTVADFALKGNQPEGSVQGMGLDLNKLEFTKGVDINTTTVNDVPVNYSVVGQELVIFPDNPDVHYSIQNVEHGKLNEVLGSLAKRALESAVDEQIGNGIGKIKGMDGFDEYLNRLPGTDTSEVIKSSASQFAQNQIPGWEKIKNAPVPSAGEKEVLLTISGDGKKPSGVKLFRLKPDGTITLY
ncbi:hypothetical protein AV656_03315 [Bhargavaea cecembensis]|uniref:LXG domain-containing protein n=1 Tax=Bhargavaea cecembensis TaxID=394098 RepID=A0A161RA90_9BACL|nr:LXG domain-containing protein [Bhargavaea cecembensis]KZE40305.1 hypothetical protein AV656_03315 [Bhargavaea cecembensis]